jgi:membrane-bound ClpP family serine protease
MTAVVLLFVVGSVLLAAEVFLPGGIAGIMGGLALAGGAGLAFSEFGAGGGSLASIGAMLLLGAMLYAELVWLPRTRLGRTMVIEATIDSQSQPPPAVAAEVVGQSAVALTPLVPTGFVSIAGKRYEAFCRTGHAPTGASLTVIGVDNFRLIVSESKQL